MRELIIREAASPVLCTTKDGGYFTLDYEIIIHKTHPLVVPIDPNDANFKWFYGWEFKACERLAKWLDGIPYIAEPPYFTTFVGESTILELTKEDAAMFKVFFC
jgi:hypothetical protein